MGITRNEMGLFAKMSTTKKRLIGVGTVMVVLALYGGFIKPLNDYRRYQHTKQDMELLFKNRKERESPDEVKDTASELK